jgi:FkbM family methyltransferase
VRSTSDLRTVRGAIQRLVASGRRIERGFIPHLGWLWHEPDDELLTLLRQGQFQAQEQAFAWLYLRPGDAILDCGAHVGMHSVLASTVTEGNAWVISVEANPSTADLLEANLEESGVRGAVVRAAVWNTRGSVRLDPERPGRAAHARVAFEPLEGAIEVPSSTIDLLLAEHGVERPALIKLDVGGAEPEALEGAARTLAGDAEPEPVEDEEGLAGAPPLVWMIEFAQASLQRRGWNTIQLGELFARHGLAVCELDEDRLQLVPASTRDTLWFKNLLATRDPDAVNARLNGAPERNREVARDILARARACREHPDELDRLRRLAQLNERWACEVGSLLSTPPTRPAAAPSLPAAAPSPVSPAASAPPAPEPRVDVCICTHNPRPEVLAIAIRALVRQTVAPGAFRVLVVDNASNPPLREEILAPLRAAGIEAALAREETPGVIHARLHAARKVRAPWCLFVDDDNELADDYVAEGLAFAARRSYVGCFGGKLLLAANLRPPKWAEPFLGYLGIKDEGDQVIVGDTARWGPWEPPGAGSWVRREQLQAFVARVERDERTRGLGRTRRDGLASREDSLIAYAAHELGLLAAYNPRLWLLHHLDPARFRARYLFRLLHGYGTSHVHFEAVKRPPGAAPARTPRQYRGFRFVKHLLKHFNRARKQSLAFGIGIFRYHQGIREAHLRLERGED